MRVYIDSIGCRLNQGEIEKYGSQFVAAGHRLVAHPSDADLVLINSCAVTDKAASDSRQKVRQAFRAGAGEIILTGCWSTLQPNEAARLPGVSLVVENSEKDDLVSHVLGSPRGVFELEPLRREAVPGTRMRTRAFVKAQDGCNNRCTFCITTLARGPGRSCPSAGVIADIQAAERSGVQEAVLTGVHLGSWGQDLSPRQRLEDLVKEILDQTSIPRLRLSSLEPWDLDYDFFRLWQNPRICRHLHLPLQSGCAHTLRRMARKTTPGNFADLVRIARQLVPGIAVTTDLIVGFPGETEVEFQESLEFVQSMEFAGGHVFTYSPRPGTAAASFEDQVPIKSSRLRGARMRIVLAASAARYRAQYMHHIIPVLWESAQGVGPHGWQFSGLTDNYLRVSTSTQQWLWNKITPVQITSMTQNGLAGKIV